MPYLVVPPAGMRPTSFFDGIRRYELPRPPVIRADRIEPHTQEFTSLIYDKDPVDAQVEESLWRVRGSGAAVTMTGTRFLDLDKIDERAALYVENEARNALERIVQRGDITIISLSASLGPDPQNGLTDWVEVTVIYVNNRAAIKKERSTSKRFPESVIR